MKQNLESGRIAETGLCNCIRCVYERRSLLQALGAQPTAAIGYDVPNDKTRGAAYSDAPLTPRGEQDAITAAMRRAFPNGHPDFIPMLVEQAKLHSDKNHDYASGGDALSNFKRLAAILALYPGLDLSDPAAVIVIQALKQFDAVLWGIANKIDHKVEGLVPRLDDILVYCGLAICRIKDNERAEKVDAKLMQPLTRYAAAAKPVKTIF